MPHQISFQMAARIRGEEGYHPFSVFHFVSTPYAVVAHEVDQFKAVRLDTAKITALSPEDFFDAMTCRYEEVIDPRHAITFVGSPPQFPALKK